MALSSPESSPWLLSGALSPLTAAIIPGGPHTMISPSPPRLAAGMWAATMSRVTYPTPPFQKMPPQLRAQEQPATRLTQTQTVLMCGCVSLSAIF